MTNIELLRLHAVLQSLRGLQQPLPGRFAVTAAYNARILEPAVEAVREAYKGPWDDEIRTFEEKRIQLVEKHGTRNEDGTLLTVRQPDGTDAIVPKDHVSWLEDYAALKVEHTDIDEIVKKRNLRIEEVNLDEAPAISIRKTKLESLPENLTMEQAEALLFMVED